MKRLSSIDKGHHLDYLTTHPLYQLTDPILDLPIVTTATLRFSTISAQDSAQIHLGPIFASATITLWAMEYSVRTSMSVAILKSTSVPYIQTVSITLDFLTVTVKMAFEATEQARGIA